MACSGRPASCEDRSGFDRADRQRAGERPAADIYTDTVMLVSVVEDIQERRRLEDKLDRLRSALDGKRTMGASF
jgi:hypothetical protein